MFDEAPPASGPPAGSNASSSSTTATSSSSSGSSSQRTRLKKNKNKNNSAAAASTSNAAAASNGHKKVESESSSDLEDALGSPNEPTASLVKKIRRKSGMSGFDQELMRIVGQHLHNIGLKTTAEVLMAEAGTQLIHPTASNFKKLVLNGEWSQAVKTLDDLKNYLENPDSMVEMKFLLLEQKYLELISKKSTIDALKVLQSELSVLKHNQARVHELSSYLMLSDPDEIARVTRSHQGSKATDVQARLDLMHRLQAFIPASVMLPPKRLLTLLEQAAEFQTDRCLRCPLSLKNPGILAPLDPSYLTKDHTCSEDDFPCETIQVLTDHCEEVWYCRFSPDGLKLASGGKDKYVNIFDFDPESMTLKFARSLDRYNHSVAFFAWSPDSTKLAVCGPEDCDEVCVWNVETGALECKIAHSAEDSLTTVAWSPDGRRIACGGERGQFYQCDAKNGNVMENKEGVRVQAMAYRKDNKTVLAADKHNRLRSYNLEDESSDKTILSERYGIMNFTIDDSDRFALLTLREQGLHLWSIEDRCLVRQYTGITANHYNIHSCFSGGSENTFLAAGSEDAKVYLYHILRENPIAELVGHTRTVNAVSWNPVYPKVLVSASDDGTLRVWGPSAKFRARSSEQNGHSSSSGSVLLEDPYHNGVI